MRVTLTLTLIAGVAASAPAAAAAAGPWSPPQDLSAAHTFVESPSLMVSGREAALATWQWRDGVTVVRRSGADAAARAAGASGFGPERVVLPARSEPELPPYAVGPVAYGSTRALAATVRTEVPRSDSSRLAVVFGDDHGRFGAPQTLVVQRRLRRPALAANGAGDAAVAWFQDVGVTNDRVLVALRRPGGRFGGPLRLATDRVRSVSVAVSPRGDVLVAWDARGTIRTRTRRAGEASFGATQTIASEPAYSATLRTAMTARGRAYVGWTAQRLSEGGGPGPFTAQVAVRPAGAARFREAQLLERQSSGARQAGVDLAVDGEDASFAWAGLDARRERIRVVRTDRRAVFGGRQDVSPEGPGDAVDPTLALDGGRRLLAWTQALLPGDDSGSGQILAAFAPAGEPFGAPETVSAGPEARTPDAAFVPSGAPTVLWSNRPAGSGGPIGGTRTIAQASTRTG